jgi:hypothetical protein
MTGRVPDRTVDEPGLRRTGAISERAGVPEPDVGGLLDDQLILDVGSGGCNRVTTYGSCSGHGILRNADSDSGMGRIPRMTD